MVHECVCFCVCVCVSFVQPFVCACYVYVRLSVPAPRTADCGDRIGTARVQVIDICSPDGVVSPKTCLYLTKWLEF